MAFAGHARSTVNIAGHQPATSSTLFAGARPGRVSGVRDEVIPHPLVVYNARLTRGGVQLGARYVFVPAETRSET